MVSLHLQKVLVIGTAGVVVAPKKQILFYSLSITILGVQSSIGCFALLKAFADGNMKSSWSFSLVYHTDYSPLVRKEIQVVVG